MIKFKYEGKEYKLEFDRATVKLLEANGFDSRRLKDGTQTLTMQELLFKAAFLKHHADVEVGTVIEMIKKFKDVTGLTLKLLEMRDEIIAEFLGDESSGNVEWVSE